MLRWPFLASVFGRLLPAGPLVPPGTPLAVAIKEWAVLSAAALRLAWWFRRRPMDDLVLTLRRGRPFHGALASPQLHQWFLERFLHRLPPRDLGPCLKRSLLLLHLFSRCGLDPQLHLGVVLGPEGRWNGHAWVSAKGMLYGAASGPADRLVEFEKLGPLRAS